MHSKEIEINDEYFMNILSRIKMYVPEFETMFEPDEVYPIVFEFTNFLIANIKDDVLVSKAAAFINEAIEKGSETTEDLIVLQVFQLFYEKKKISNILTSKLSAKAKTIFEKFYKKYKN